MRNGHSTGSYNSDICNGAGHQSCPAWTTQNRYLQFRSGFSQHRYCLCPSLVGRIFWLTIHPKLSGISTGDMVLNQLRRACRRRRRTCPIWMERYYQNHCRFFSNFCCQFYCRQIFNCFDNIFRPRKRGAMQVCGHFHRPRFTGLLFGL